VGLSVANVRAAATFRIFGAPRRQSRSRAIRTDSLCRAQLWDVVGVGYHADWFCPVASHGHRARGRRLLRRLLTLPGEELLDVCGDETD
jgi:hypothetical protein